MVIGDLREPGRVRRGIDRYRERFRPSQWASEPYVVASGTVAGGRTPEEARRLLIPEPGRWRTPDPRQFPPLPPAERVETLSLSAKERGFYESGLSGHWPPPRRVAHRLETVLEETGAQEVLVTTSTHDREALLDSYRRLAAIAGLDGGTATRR
ncbi:hypothetical protein GCM10023238_00410 [Streptomyces heliomycini]